jgi:hypothetical protein
MLRILSVHRTLNIGTNSKAPRERGFTIGTAGRTRTDMTITVEGF